MLSISVQRCPPVPGGLMIDLPLDATCSVSSPYFPVVAGLASVLIIVSQVRVVETHRSWDSCAKEIYLKLWAGSRQ